jgi:DNA-binding LacI/PurR family transcriptional regulator
MTTMKAVALRAGVSTATVSRVLSGDGSGVRQELRDRVREAARELGYQPNQLARNLRARTSRIVGLVISDISNPYFTGIARACQDALQQHGYSLVLCNTDDDPDREAISLRELAEERAAGVILASGSAAGDEGTSHLAAAGIPLVAVDRHVRGLHLDCVTVDDETAAWRATHHLVEAGHTRIGLLGGTSALSNIRARHEGYVRALREARLPVDASLMLEGNLREPAGFAMAMELLDRPEPPTALFSVNIMTTVGMLRAIRDLRLGIPADVSIVGFDDVPMGELLDPPLTVVRQPTYQIGARAAQLLLRRIREPDAPIQESMLSASLVVRRSTGRVGGMRTMRTRSSHARPDRRAAVDG